MSDPYLTLGVRDDADNAAIQQAYLDGVRRFPADRDPERFQAIRAAYEQLRDTRARLAYGLFHAEPPTPAELVQRLTRDARPGRPTLEQMQAALRGGRHG
jgi:curved DNA-binding protein CbpA